MAIDKIRQYVKYDLVNLESVTSMVDYNGIFDKFINSTNEYLKSLKRSSVNIMSPTPTMEAKNNSSPSENIAKIKKDKKLSLNKLAERWRTPLAQRTNFIVKKASEYQAPDIEPFSELNDISYHSKKRSAQMADISLVVDDDTDNDIDSDTKSITDDSESSVKVKLFKNDKKKKGKKKVGEKSKSVDEEMDVKVELVTDPKNPSKKIKLDEKTNTVKKKKSKKTAVKSNTSLNDSYAVEDIIDIRIENNTEEYLIKWKGFSNIENTWEPLENLHHCQNLVDEFKENNKAKQAIKTEGTENTENESTVPKSSKKTKVSKKKKGPKKKAVVPVDIEDVEGATKNETEIETPATTSKKTKKAKKSKLSKAKEEDSVETKGPNILSTKTPSRTESVIKFVATKTPGSIMNNRRVSRLLVQSAIRKSIQKSNRRPITRRAAAEAASRVARANKDGVPMTKKPMNPVVSALRNEGKPASGSPVKKLIGKFENINRSPGIKTPVTATKGKFRIETDSPKSVMRIKTKNPIDDRKKIAGVAKLEARRMSVKKTKQFFLQANLDQSSTNDIKSKNPPKKSKQEHAEIMDETIDIEIKTPTPVKTRIQDETLCESSDEKTPVNIRLSCNVQNDKEKDEVDKILKSKSPCSVTLSIIPVGMISNNRTSASAFLADQQKRLSTKDFTTTTQNPIFKTYANPLTKMTPSKSHDYKLNTLGTGFNNKFTNNFSNKFMERNTPSKMSRTEQEEKLKAELHAKENKEKERLAEQERLKQEKSKESKRKREEKQKKIQELKQKKEMELEQKRKEIENRQAQSTLPKVTSSSSNTNNSIMQKSSFLNSTHTQLHKKAYVPQNFEHLKTNRNTNSTNTAAPSKKMSVVDQLSLENFANNFGKFKQAMQENDNDENIPPKTNKYDLNTSYNKNQNKLETTFTLQSPPSLALKPITNKPDISKPKTSITNYECTPLQTPKLKDINNYDVSNLGSEDDTDDDEEPSKPLPDWAIQTNLQPKVKSQNRSLVNFTLMFKSASQSEIILENIFKTRRKKFTDRSSSANWNCPPVWNSNGLTGEESFRVFRGDI